VTQTVGLIGGVTATGRNTTSADGLFCEDGQFTSPQTGITASFTASVSVAGNMALAAFK
jgi:hypothetical protein